MAVQIIVSLCKVNSKPKGTSIEFQEFRSSVNLSLTACKLDVDLGETDPGIRPFIKLIYSLNNSEYVDEYNSDAFRSNLTYFYWLNNGLMHICNTIGLKSAEEIRIVHSYGRNINDENMILYIHEAGLFGSGYEVKVNNDYYGGSTITLLELQQIIKLPDTNTCQLNLSFEICKQRYISNEYRTRTGCNLRLER